ncbi:hypothetical protein NKH77_55895 [Streptomyces sp. M19]
MTAAKERLWQRGKTRTRWTACGTDWDAVCVEPMVAGLDALASMRADPRRGHWVLADHLRNRLYVAVPTGSAAVFAGIGGVRVLSTGHQVLTPSTVEDGTMTADWVSHPAAPRRPSWSTPPGSPPSCGTWPRRRRPPVILYEPGDREPYLSLVAAVLAWSEPGTPSGRATASRSRYSSPSTPAPSPAMSGATPTSCPAPAVGGRSPRWYSPRPTASWQRPPRAPCGAPSSRLVWSGISTHASIGWRPSSWAHRLCCRQPLPLSGPVELHGGARIVRRSEKSAGCPSSRFSGRTEEAFTLGSNCSTSLTVRVRDRVAWRSWSGWFGRARARHCAMSRGPGSSAPSTTGRSLSRSIWSTCCGGILSDSASITSAMISRRLRVTAAETCMPALAADATRRDSRSSWPSIKTRCPVLWPEARWPRRRRSCCSSSAPW